MIRAGIIGWGENGMKIAQALHFEIKDTEVVGISTVDPIGKDYATRKMSLKHVFSSHTQLLELHQIDIICICSEGDMHLAHIEDAIKSGSNIFIDHPFASNVEDCKKLEKIIDSYPSYKSTVAFPRRFNPRLNQIQKEISKGGLGQLIRVECQTYEKMQIEDAEEKRRKSRKGIFMDLMLQDIDLIRWLTGSEYSSVYALGNALKYPSLSRTGDADSVVAVATLESGCMVNFISSRVTHSGEGFKLKVVGTNGEVEYSSFDRNSALVSSLENKPYYLSEEPCYNEYIPLLKDYVDAIKSGSRIAFKLADGTAATAVAVAMTKSFVMGKEINLKD